MVSTGVSGCCRPGNLLRDPDRRPAQPPLLKRFAASTLEIFQKEYILQALLASRATAGAGRMNG